MRSICWFLPVVMCVTVGAQNAGPDRAPDTTTYITHVTVIDRQVTLTSIVSVIAFQASWTLRSHVIIRPVDCVRLHYGKHAHDARH